MELKALEPSAVVVVTISFPVESVPRTEADFVFVSVIFPCTCKVVAGVVVPMPTLPPKVDVAAPTVNIFAPRFTFPVAPV